MRERTAEEQRRRRDPGLPPWGAGLVVLGGLALLSAIVAGSRALLVPRAGLEVPPATPLVECDDVRPSADAVTSSAQLLECPAEFDGQRIRFRGEAVSHLLERGAFTWAQLNDDVYGLDLGPVEVHHQPLGSNSSMAVALTTDAADLIRNLGGSRRRGDVVEVVGTFRVAAALDQGGTAIVADEVVLLRSGGPLDVPPAAAQRVTAVVLLLVTAALALPVLRRSRR